MSREWPELDLFSKTLLELAPLETKARSGTLNDVEKKRLRAIGYRFLYELDNCYKARLVFTMLKDTIGLQRIVEYMRANKPNDTDLMVTLRVLEDHEGIREELNRMLDPERSESVDPSTQHGFLEKAFQPLSNAVAAHRKHFVAANEGLQVTGIVTLGQDLVALRNLAQRFDVAVSIARGGLPQGAMTHLWGMLTKVALVKAHEREVPTGRWVTPVSPEDFEGKRVLLLDKDAVSGASVRHTMGMIQPFSPKSVGIYFGHPQPTPPRIPDYESLPGLPDGLEIFHPEQAPFEEAGEAYIEARRKLKKYLK